MEIPKHRPKSPEDEAEEYEKQRELYRQGANYRNIRKQRASQQQERPFVPVTPETKARELERQESIKKGPKSRFDGEDDVETFQESYDILGLAARFGALS